MFIANNAKGHTTLKGSNYSTSIIFYNEKNGNSKRFSGFADTKFSNRQSNDGQTKSTLIPINVSEHKHQSNVEKTEGTNDLHQKSDFFETVRKELRSKLIKLCKENT